MRAATGFEPSDKWFGQQAVYRISMGNFVSSTRALERWSCLQQSNAELPELSGSYSSLALVAP